MGHRAAVSAHSHPHAGRRHFSSRVIQHVTTDNFHLRSAVMTCLGQLVKVSTLQTGSARWIQRFRFAGGHAKRKIRAVALQSPSDPVPPGRLLSPAAQPRRARAPQFAEQLPRALPPPRPPGHHGVRRAGSGGASPQGLVSVLLRVRSPESLCPPR